MVRENRPFDFQPSLTGDLLTMRPTDAEDFEPLCAIASDAAVWTQHPVPELSRREVFRSNIDDAFGDEGGLTPRDINSGEIVPSPSAGAGSERLS